MSRYSKVMKIYISNNSNIVTITDATPSYLHGVDYKSDIVVVHLRYLNQDYYYDKDIKSLSHKKAKQLIKEWKIKTTLGI